MRTIPETFSKNGWNHHQLERRGQWALYERCKSGGVPHYEVIRIRSHKGFKIPGTETMAEPAEYYPSAEAWGTDGFTHSIIEDARAKFEAMHAKELEKATYDSRN